MKVHVLTDDHGLVTAVVCGNVDDLRPEVDDAYEIATFTVQTTDDVNDWDWGDDAKEKES